MWQVIKTTIARDRAVSWGFITGGLLVLINLGLTAWWGWRLPPEVPLFYSLPTGEQQLATNQWFLILPITGLVFYGLAFWLVGCTRGMVSVFPQMVVWLSNIAILFTTIAMIHILWLVY